MEERGLMEYQNQLLGELTGLQVDTVTNGFTNMIARNGRTQEQLQNLEQLERAVPDKDACSNVSKALDLSDVYCTVDAEKERVLSEHTKSFNKGITGTPQEMADIKREYQKPISNACDALKDANGNSLCANGSLLTGEKSVLTEQEERATDMQIKLLAGTPKHHNPAGDGPGRAAYVQHGLRVEAVRSMAVNSLNTVRAEMVGENGKGSVMTLLEEYDLSRAMDPEWMAEIANAHKDKSKGSQHQVMPTELLRKSVAIEAMMLHLQIKSYQSQLRTEAMAATTLALEVEPLQ